MYWSGHTLSRRVASALVTVVLVGLLSGINVEGAAAVIPAQEQAKVVSAVPSAATPNITTGSVQTIAEVASADAQTRMVAGGDFTTVQSAGSSTTLTRRYLLAFNPTTGVVDTTFVPALNGSVDAVVPSADGKSVYVGGGFNTVNGVASKSLARLDIATGSGVAGFQVPVFDGQVRDIRLAGARLYVGGTFTTVNGAPHGGLVALDPTTGAVDPFVNLQFSGHHYAPGNAPVGVLKIDVTPDGARMVAIGNFVTVDGLTRDQIVMIDLSGAQPAVDTGWATAVYSAVCGGLDGYVRGLQFSPDGSYFVTASTGGYDAGSFQACDTAARFETSATGTDVQPTWYQVTGTDSLYSVAISGTAVYVGGHQRWLNNPYGADTPSPGAVPRPGLAALDPKNGVPLAWNPGRNPRGHGTEALLVTSTGLWMGSDTSYIGDNQYYRDRIAFFPLAGGSTIPASNTGPLPGKAYLAGPVSADGSVYTNDISSRSYDGASSVGATASRSDTGIDWSNTRGAVMINQTLYYGWSDGNLYSRSFDGTTYGPATLVDPYDDPYWSNVSTGSGQTYRGTPSSFYGEITSVTGMAFADGFLYYTLLGDRTLYSRAFTPDSGIVAAQRQVADTSIDWSDAGGMFFANDRIYWATRKNGNLHRADFIDGHPVPASATVVSGPAMDGNDWRSRGLFLTTVVSTK